MVQRHLRDMAAEAGAGFGTSGVRGLVTSLTPDLCAAYTWAFLAILETPARFLLIGHDLRPSSPAIAAACHAAARAAGVMSVYAGALPTPALAFAAQREGVPAIMVTGSHIPFDRNGLKFYRAEGEITKADEQRILSFALPQADAAVTLEAGLPPEDPAPRDAYAARYRLVFGAGALSGLRIGVYEHSSVARGLLHDVLRSLGAETIGLGRSDQFVAIDTEAVRAEDRAIAPVWARDDQLDAIVTTDGDADRPLIADERGEWLRGDVLGLLAARALGAGSVVTPLSSSTAIEASGAFREVRRTRIGSPHVIAGMEQAAYHPVVGFEANGGFLLGSDVSLNGRTLASLMTRDAVLPMLLVLADAKRSNRPLSALLADLPQRHTASGRLQEIDPAACRTLLNSGLDDPEAVAALLGDGTAALESVDRLDGVRASFANGDIVHVRASGNAPELRCYAESHGMEQAERLWRACLARLQPLVSGTPGS